MAGDWIKVEHATLDKPEVLRTAEVLGISRDAALGLYFRFWVWLDKNLSDFCPDSVRNVSKKSLDSVLQCPGFSAMLEAVGWAEFDDSAWTMRISNAARHNGNTAKTRALDAKRKAEERANPVQKMSGSKPDKNRTREEKRREEITTSLRSVVTPPPGIPSPEHRNLAAQLGVDCDGEAAKYRDYLLANGKRPKDAVAGFRNWLRKAAEFRRERVARPQTLAERRAANMDVLTGKVRHERPIFAERVDHAVVLALPGDLREQGGDDVGGGGPGRIAASVGG